MTSPNVAGTGPRDVEQSRPGDHPLPAGTRSTDESPGETLLREGLAACFATSGGNTQTPDVIFNFLRIAWLPAIERAAADAVTDESGPSGPSRAPEGGRGAARPGATGPFWRDGESVVAPGDAGIHCPGARCLTLIPADVWLCRFCARTYAILYANNLR